MTDVELVRLLIPQWHAMRAWAESMMCHTLGITEPAEAMRARVEGRGSPQPVPGTTWTYQLHGKGVRFDRGFGVGGIDFDFDTPMPDMHRLIEFAEAQFNAGNLPLEYREMIDDHGRLRTAAEVVLGEVSA